MSFSLSAEQSAIVTWLANRVTPAAAITYSSELVANAGGNWEVRYVTFSSGVDHYTSNLDADLTLPNGPTVVQANIKEALAHNPAPTIEYYPMPTPPPPPPAPPTNTIVDSPIRIVEGRQWKTQTNLTTGQTQEMELTFIGWQVFGWKDAGK
jgi:hypothetical protein